MPHCTSIITIPSFFFYLNKEKYLHNNTYWNVTSRVVQQYFSKLPDFLFKKKVNFFSRTKLITRDMKFPVTLINAYFPENKLRTGVGDPMIQVAPYGILTVSG